MTEQKQPKVEPPDDPDEVEVTPKGNGVELGYYSSWDKAQLGMADPK